jgi:antitoxin component of MazEF toxin-antitoxin module
MNETKQITWKRFIIKLHNTFYVSLPKEYIEGMNLDKDVEVDLKFNTDGSLTLIPMEAD